MRIETQADLAALRAKIRSLQKMRADSLIDEETLGNLLALAEEAITMRKPADEAPLRDDNPTMARAKEALGIPDFDFGAGLEKLKAQCDRSTAAGRALYRALSGVADVRED
jgi:hypothetical protein